MKENRIDDRNDDKRSADDDQLRSNTMNEAIRQTSGDPDMDINDIKETDEDVETRERRARGDDLNQTQGVSYNPNDASAVRSGGIADMDDQTAGGAGQNTGVRKGLGSELNTKKGVTGSDFDGQNATS